jgi:hypothetical protein
MLGLGFGLNRGRRVGGFVGLLDTFTGAAAAFSRYKLRKDYTGAAVRVRESGGNTEADIGFLADGTPDNASLLAFCGANDGFVTVWYDQSGNGKNAVNATSTEQPKIVSSGALVTSNGFDVIQYDGTNDNLTITSLTATGTMLMAGSEGSGFYEVDINGNYSMIASANNTDYPLNETLRIIWDRNLSAGEKTAIEALVTYTDWDFGGITNFGNYWRGRSELTDFPILDVSDGTSFTGAWRDCSSLQAFPFLDVSSGTGFFRAWNDCSSLEDFPEDFFNSCTATNFTNAFLNCALSETSVNNILISIESNDTSGGTLDINGGTSAAPTGAGLTAIDDLEDRGWTVNTN